MQRITPCLWFDKNCEEAINHYISTFNDAPNRTAESKIISIQRYEKGINAPGAEEMEGKIITAIFELDGQRFMALDGGPIFQFNEATSFLVECQDQAEVDYFWGKLSAVAESEQCGWCKDRFGLSWQIVPKVLGELSSDPDPVKAKRVLNAMLEMKKIDVAELERAYRGE
jgi:predicted 3-demethylubiquinone-9 3-methyltransferase (glyoxalase superfamily)